VTSERLVRPAADDVVVDSSAIVALLTDEAASPALARALASASSAVMSAGTRLELGIVVEARLGPAGGRLLDDLLVDAAIDVWPVDDRLAALAVRSWRAYGKGRHHAALNFGDCFTHALAVHTGLPVLCVGDDFARTGVEVVDLDPFRSS
jgi:ribonuclease VapC